MVVTLFSRFYDNADLAKANVIGSNVTKVLLVLGIAAVISPLTVQNSKSKYTVLLHGCDGKSFMLVSENDSVLISSKLEQLILTLKEIGFKKAKVYF
jgi:Ca2+/Na+ antiporter